MCNPVALTAAAGFRPLKLFIVQLALGEAEKRIGRQLDPKFKLPKMQHKGELSPLPLHLLAAGLDANVAGTSGGIVIPGGERDGQQNQANGKIQEVGAGTVGAMESIKPSGALAASAAATGSGLVEERQSSEGYEVRYSVQYDCRPVEQVIVTLQLPAPAVAAVERDGSGAIAVTVAGDVLSVSAPLCQPVSVQLPLMVAGGDGGSVASLLVAKGALVVRLPWRRFSDVRWAGPALGS